MKLTSYSTQKNKFQLPCDDHVFRGGSPKKVFIFFYDRDYGQEGTF